MGENLDWEWDTETDPYVSWYDDEEPCADGTCGHDEDDDNHTYIHYYNITASDYDTTGFDCALGGIYGVAYSQTFDESSYMKDHAEIDDMVMTVDEYEELFDAYYESVTEASATTDALEAAQAARASAQEGADSASAALQSAKDAYCAADRAASDYSASSAAAKDKTDSATTALGEAESNYSMAMEEYVEVLPAAEGGET